MLRAFIKKLNTEIRDQWVAEAAYYKSEARGFDPDRALDDWLEAERDYFHMLINLQLNVLEEDGSVTTMGLRQIAESLGVRHPEILRSEAELITAIQSACRHRPCFRASNAPECDEDDCHWRSRCKRLVAVWHR